MYRFFLIAIIAALSLSAYVQDDSAQYVEVRMTWNVTETFATIRIIDGESETDVKDEDGKRTKFRHAIPNVCNYMNERGYEYVDQIPSQLQTQTKLLFKRK